MNSGLSRESVEFLSRKKSTASPLLESSVRTVAEVVRSRCAIDLGMENAHFIAQRLEAAAAEAGCASVDALAELLSRAPSAKLVEAVVEAVVVGETSFFRDATPFEVLKNRVLPYFAERRAASRRMRIWSAACSTGQEPYGVAACVRDSGIAESGFAVSIVATDVSKKALAKARSGAYSAFEMRRGVLPTARSAYFDEKPEAFVVHPDLRRLVEFRRLNLAGPWQKGPPYDVILLRNVLIYFDVPTRRDIIRRMRASLADDGLLLLGAGESLLGVDEGFVSAEPEFPWYLKRRK